jgi:hypothetical protein
MSYVGAKEFFFEVAKGNVPGHAHVLIRGHTPTQTAASGFVDVAEHGNLAYLSSAETMEVASTSAADTSAGTGLRTLLLQGVDGSGAEISEVVVLNGTTNVTSSLSYLRVNTMVGLTAGSSGWNEGSVTATATTAGTIQSEMDATESLSQSSHYTVPLGKTFYLTQVELNSAKLSGGSAPEIEFKGYARPGGAGAAWLQLFDKKLDTGVSDELDVVISHHPGVLIARTDVRMRADTDTNGTECRTRMYGVLVDD